jgi:hypothetical protein
MIKRTCIAKNQQIRAKKVTLTLSNFFCKFNHRNSTQMLLDKLGHARSLGIEGNHNALHGFEGIADLANNS